MTRKKRRSTFSHNPFSMAAGAGSRRCKPRDPLTIKAFQYDITCNGYEIASGGIRNHRPEAMVKAFEIAGYGEKDVVERFRRHVPRLPSMVPRHNGGHGRRGSIASSCSCAAPQNLREISLFPMKPARRRPADGRAFGGDAEAVARASHPAQSAGQSVSPTVPFEASTRNCASRSDRVGPQ